MQRLVVVGVEGGADPDAAALGRAVANRVRGAEDPTGLLNERRRRRSSTDNDRLYVIEVVLGDVGQVEQEGDLRRDAGDGRHLVSGDQIENRAGSPTLEEMCGATAGQHPRQLGHEADVGHRDRREAMAATTPGAAGVEIGDCLKLTIGVPTAARLAGGAAGEADAHRAFGIVGQVGHRCRIRHPKSGRHGVGVVSGVDDSDRRVDRPHRRCEGRRGDHEIGVQYTDARPQLWPGETGIEAGSHGAETSGGEVQHDEVDVRRRCEREHRPRSDPLVEEPGGGLVRGAIELGIGDRPAVFGDECLGVGEFDRGAAGDLGEHPDPYSSMKVFSALPATTCLRILPVALRGSGSVRISQCAGTLWEARVAPTNAASSSVVTSASSKGTT